ncbi:indole-3-acetic acid-amido synthetase GH3.10 [Selaginella moellendorffii]|uniref:indole-3-acetic acid-amido synthetase GH3.10 n=1 Tax=Selaginella moellendorffii TaxID=88036 RepID=UPI000D1C8013|nr:indole-3-acetic acid-amido synthetase GH3.10 [Selaginella moellendorffii]|eukprot:XP_024519921.1 indole-3-acetic acid-amido synthetase GH3.10 [Selaginella moellendorffii]
MPGIPLISHSDALTYGFEELARNGNVVQAELLEQILVQNADADYLKEHKLNGCTDLETFKARLPLITYADIEGYIQKIADGDQSPVLCQKPVDMFFLSSGTAKGRTKLIPAHYDFFLNTIRLFQLSGAFRGRHFPLSSNAKVMDIVYCGKQTMTKGGILTGTGTTNYFRSEAFKLKQQSTKMFNSSPNEVIFSSSLPQATYCHLLFALLAADDIAVISSTFVYTIVEAFRFLEKTWSILADCIESGTLPEWITDHAIQTVASKQLTQDHPDRDRGTLAAKIRLECSRGFQGIIPRLWRNTSYVLSIMTGTMLSYCEAMRFYAGPGLALVCGDYGASESWMGINIDPLSSPHNTIFTIVPDLAYFEFIPLERRKFSKIQEINGPVVPPSSLFTEVAAPVSMADVRVGQEYEIAITTSSGLYRYRVGDVVRICGFYHDLPQFVFVCRRDVQLSIHIDKNGETELAVVMERSAAVLHGTGVGVAEYTAHADVSFRPGHYVVFVELDVDVDVDVDLDVPHVRKGNQGSSKVAQEKRDDFERVLQECCDCMDGAFVEPGYVVSRAAKTIGPLELCVVERGTFRKLAESALDKGATLNQYKTPRCIAAPHLLAILRAGMVRSFYSGVRRE